MPGSLFVVATPIGNLEDITLRALRTLREVHLIAAEDTRRTAKLLSHYDIHTPMVSLHTHNERREAPRLIEQLTAGASIALVTDAGTPGISDPGQFFVHLALEHGIKVVPIPGPSAVTAALSASGLPASEFVFMGFPPASGKDRRAWFDRLAADPRTVVAYEAPHRIAKTLADLAGKLVNRQIIVLRELTKKHEELVIYTNMSADKSVEPRGEIALIIAPSEQTLHDLARQGLAVEHAIRMVGCMTTNSEFDDEMAIQLSAKASGLDVRTVRNAWKKHKIQAKRRSQ